MTGAASDLRLAIRFASRELRSGFSGFRIFLAALTLGIAAIAGVGSLGQSFLTGLAEEGRTLLGGDVRMQRLYQPTEEPERAFMARFGSVSESASLRSMATDTANPENRTLIELKSVDEAYPLLGAIVLMPAMPLADALSCEASACGAVVEEALLARLKLAVGAHVKIGQTDFVIGARIVSEPDRVAGGFTLGPHVLVSREGLMRAGLVTPGSLINYSYRVAFSGDPDAESTPTPQGFREAAETAFPDGHWEFRDRGNAIPRVTRFVEQATMFLTLVGLTALIVAGVGAGQAVEAFLQRRRETIATLKAIGAEGGQIFLIYLLQVMAVAAVALVSGLVIGAALPFAVKYYFGDDIPAPAHYAVYAGPLALAALFGILAAAGFAIPPLARAREIAPAGLFRDLVSPSGKHARWPYRAVAIGAFAAIAVLSVALSPYRLFTLGFLAGTAIAIVLLRLVAVLLRRSIRMLPRRKSQLLRLAFANLTRPGTPTAGIIVALGLGLSLLATVALMQSSVERQVEDQLPERAPSFFFVDIQQDQIDAFTRLVSGFPSSTDFSVTPMLRGRIVKLAGVPVQDAKVAPGSRWPLDGDRAITYARTAPKDARVVEGPDWWPTDYQGPTLVSFDRDLARGMGLKLGDTITVNVVGRDIDLRIYNLRDIDFRTGGQNFIFILSPGVIDQAPHTFLSSVRAGPADEDAIFAGVSRSFPNVTMVRVKEALAQVGELLAALARGIEVASLVTILAGVLVLAGAIAAGHRARLYDAVVLKVLGATRFRLGAVYAVEYGILGVLAGLAALGAGTLAAWAIAYFVLDIAFVFAAKAVAFTIVGGAFGTLILGLSGGFAALAAKPAARLRESLSSSCDKLRDVLMSRLRKPILGTISWIGDSRRIATMAEYENRVRSVGVQAGAIDEGLRAYMLRVYNYMLMGLALTGGVAYATANIPAVRGIFFAVNPATGGVGLTLPGMIAIFAPIGLVFFLGFRLQRMSFQAAQTTFWIYAGLMGISIASILLQFTGVSVARVFFITAATFGAMSLYGYTTKRDLTGMGSFLFMGLIGLIIASVVNIFLASAMIHWVISVIGVGIFVGLTAYDTQRIKHEYAYFQGGEMAGKMAIMGALRLYLDFINLFVMLIQLMGDRR